jgi:hypothetical protein
MCISWCLLNIQNTKICCGFFSGWIPIFRQKELSWTPMRSGSSFANNYSVGGGTIIELKGALNNQVFTLLKTMYLTVIAELP